ncbi:MAG: hypothetical protein LBV43_05995, partial [Prevotella sp.]|nr:hypothetical protein [Prevotella sp.]
MVYIKVNKHAIRNIFVILLCCIYIPLSAQSDSIAQVASSSEDKTVDFRVPDKGKIEEYSKDSRFDYSQVPTGKISAWDRIKYWLYDTFNDIVRAVSRSGMPGIVVIVIFALLIVLLILRFSGIDFRKVLGKKEIDTPEIDIYTENVHEMDFDTLIANAMKNNDYRLVIRFLYLKNLKLLSDKEIIEWKTNKTNYSYQHEISNSALRSKFLEA